MEHFYFWLILSICCFIMYLIKNIILNGPKPKTSSITTNTSNSHPVIIKDKKDGLVRLNKLNPSTKVPFYGITGSVKSVKKLNSVEWQVECHSKEQQQKLLTTNDLAGVSISSYIPTPRSEGIVYGLKDPLALSHHPDVIKFQVISDTRHAKTYTTRIVFGKEPLPSTLFSENSEHEVFPYLPPSKRCTKCQSLSHTKRECTNAMKCSRCGQTHSRASCTAPTPKCVNCDGPHSAAYSQCPKVIGSNQISNNKSKLPVKKSLSTNSSYAEKVKNMSYSIPSFITFITTVVIPILTLNNTINIVNQLVKVYNDFLGLDYRLSAEDRVSAENLLKLKVDSIQSDNVKTDNTPTVSNSATPPPTSQSSDRKQVFKLKNFVINPESRNIIIGDSTTKGISDDPSVATQVLCIPGLTIGDVQAWLKSFQSLKMDNVILHVGINSCRKTPLTVKDWSPLINQTKSKFPDANLHFSSILPASGHLKKNVDHSNTALKEACMKFKTSFVSNRSAFVTYTGQIQRQLYTRDGIHPNQTGAALLSMNLFSVLDVN